MLDVEPEMPKPITELRVRGTCPYCSSYSYFNYIASSPSNINKDVVGSIYHCVSCRNIIFIKWGVKEIRSNISWVRSPELMHIQTPEADLQYVPEEIKKEYAEALKCFGINCYNAFSAMSRRTIQAICLDKNIGGTAKVKKQVQRLIEEFGDIEIEEILDELIKTGHNGAHPHLPKVDKERAALTLRLMNDLLDQIYNRPGRIEEIKKMRASSSQKTS